MTATFVDIVGTPVLIVEAVESIPEVQPGSPVIGIIQRDVSITPLVFEKFVMSRAEVIRLSQLINSNIL